MKKKIYIAGKVTGEDRAECTAKFANAQKAIQELGFEVINPIEVVGDWDTNWNVAMRLCIAKLTECDALVLLLDWKESSGALIEAKLANSLEIPVFTFSRTGLHVLKLNLCNS
jgi:nucleoside 2-deoxyribosyltransferase